VGKVIATASKQREHFPEIPGAEIPGEIPGV